MNDSNLHFAEVMCAIVNRSLRHAIAVGPASDERRDTGEKTPFLACSFVDGLGTEGRQEACSEFSNGRSNTRAKSDAGDQCSPPAENPVIYFVSPMASLNTASVFLAVSSHVKSRALSMPFAISESRNCSSESTLCKPSAMLWTSSGLT